MKYDATELLKIADDMQHEEHYECHGPLRIAVAEVERLRTENARVEAMIENPLFLLAVRGGASIDDIRQFIREAKQGE